MGETVEALVDAGKASAGPPLGPALGPSGVNVKEVINQINSQTKDMAGCLLYTSPSPRDGLLSRMPSSA